MELYKNLCHIFNWKSDILKTRVHFSCNDNLCICFIYRCERLSKRIWKEIFAVIRIVFSIFIWFFIELFRYVAKHIFQPIVHGIFATVGDFVFKPFLNALFNGFLQPFSIFLWNVFTGLRHMFRPVGEILERVFLQLAMLFRSIRLFEINWNSTGHSAGQQMAGYQHAPAQVI